MKAISYIIIITLMVIISIGTIAIYYAWYSPLEKGALSGSSSQTAVTLQSSLARIEIVEIKKFICDDGHVGVRITVRNLDGNIRIGVTNENPYVNVSMCSPKISSCIDRSEKCNKTLNATTCFNKYINCLNSCQSSLNNCINNCETLFDKCIDNCYNSAINCLNNCINVCGFNIECLINCIKNCFKNFISCIDTCINNLNLCINTCNNNYNLCINKCKNEYNMCLKKSTGCSFDRKTDISDTLKPFEVTRLRICTMSGQMNKLRFFNANNNATIMYYYLIP